jgi:hypothetical protein
MRRSVLLTATGILFILVILASGSGPAAKLDPTSECSAPNDWFPHEKTPPPNNNLAPQTNCDFHKWSWQSFLWLTQENNRKLRFLNFHTEEELLKGEKSTAGELLLLPRVAKADGGETLDDLTQAQTRGVLIDRKHRAVYYAVHMNDIYYNFIKENQLLDPKTFIKTSPDTAFPIGALITKSSWWIVPPGQDAEGYYCTTGSIGCIVSSEKGQLIVCGTISNVKVALVGLHVVGVVRDHPEFLWATFEHKDNAPNLPPNLKPKSPEPVSDKDWTFYAKDTPANKCNLLNADEVQLVNAKKQTLDPRTNVFRQYAWGGGTEENQANIEALNDNIHKKLPPKSVWRNYNLIGTVWLPPNSLKPNQFTLSDNTAGSTHLANATMETFAQPSNCFSCHNTLPVRCLGKIIIPGKNLNLSHLLLDAYLQRLKDSKAKQSGSS